MKILFNSIHLFLFSLYVDFYKYRFDRAVKKRLKNGKDISTKKLTQMSDKCYYLFNSFIEKEKRLRLKMSPRAQGGAPQKIRRCRRGSRFGALRFSENLILRGAARRGSPPFLEKYSYLTQNIVFRP